MDATVGGERSRAGERRDVHERDRARWAMLLPLAGIAAIGCAASRVPTTSAPGDARSAEGILTGCQRAAMGTGTVRYDCQGFSAVANDAQQDTADPDGDVDQLVASIVEEFEPMREKLGARVRVEKSVIEVEGAETHAAKVSADDPKDAGRSFAAGYVIVSGTRRLVCTTRAGDGMETCQPAMRALLHRTNR
jgi:hypothetical protein